MITMSWRLGAAALLIVTIMATGIGSAPAAAEGPTRSWTPPGQQYVPRTDGEWIVWIDGRDSADYGGQYEIFAAHMDDGQEFVIAPGMVQRAYADVHNGIAVWAERNYAGASTRMDVVGFHLETRQAFLISGTDLNETHPAMGGDYVVWVQREEGVDSLMARNIVTMDPPFLVASAATGMNMDLPRMEDDRVIWAESRFLGAGSSQYRLFVSTLTTGEIDLIDEGTVAGRGLTDDYDISGDRVAYAINRDLRYLNLTTGETQQLSLTGACPSIHGDYIFWEDFLNYGDDRIIELWGYDMRTGSIFQAATGPGGSHEYPHLGGDLVVWQATVGADRDIFAAPLKNILPTAPRPAERAGEDDFYFVETGHTLGNEFKAFWSQSGGLPVFGFSLTEEFTELNADTGELYTVQYLERQRFEHHPELAGTPYEVLIGRLGVAAAERRGLLQTEPFQPIAGNPGGDDCAFFAETGHSLCGRFLDYWQRHGLDMGDEGVSFRESLALFGYPISEVFVDPETGLTSQYFERAIFEHHPEHDGTPYEVLLVRLGAQELADRDW
jgi:hypothetical protein